ncbi:ArsR/SmtB family transcription factor [Halobaculum magnesiiphilum]|uniref:Metalloregulator ArsR/SmtB family transcription factor n=1 Tax=Halobaculum magnesiiphilum TaxID=1017351 RepID=A0A8T8W997_9EURY|nr:metalloregulator ArsR/SmtB family transcription factor [Halobaculum magnesiiphilum]QZP36354.1 metalloregulator ArsR/SmtB family transcription factor [Halobaculum magnesiiphilum]
MAGQKPELGTEDGRSDRPSGCCSAEHDLRDDDVAADVETLSALGNDTRYEALRLIAGAEDDICVCELEPSLGVSQSAVSQALSRLFGAGLVERRKEGRWRYYSATPRAERLLDVLDETRGVGDD